MQILLRNAVHQICHRSSRQLQNPPVRSTAKAISVLAASTFLAGFLVFPSPGLAATASCVLGEKDADGEAIADPVSNSAFGLSLQLHQPMEKIAENTYRFFFYYHVRNYTSGDGGSDGENVQITHDLSKHFPKAKSVKVPVSDAGKLFFVNDVPINLDGDFDAGIEAITSDDTVVLTGNEGFGQSVDGTIDWNVLEPGQTLPKGTVSTLAVPGDSPSGKAGIIGVLVEVDFGNSVVAALGNATLTVDGAVVDVSTQGPVPDSDEPDFLHPPEGVERAEICGPENSVPTAVYLPQPVAATLQSEICGAGKAEANNLVKNPYFSSFPKDVPAAGLPAGAEIAGSFSSDAVYIGNNLISGEGATELNQISINGGTLDGADVVTVILHSDTTQQHPFPGDSSRWEHEKPALRWLFSSGNNSADDHQFDEDPPFSVWKQTVAVTKGKTYAFSAYISNPVWADRNLFDNALEPKLQMFAGNTALLADGGVSIKVEDLATDKGDVWKLYHGRFVAEGPSIDLSIQNGQPLDFLNKLATTGISLAECGDDKDADGKADNVVDAPASTTEDGGSSGGGGGSIGLALLLAGIPALLRRRKRF